MGTTIYALSLLFVICVDGVCFTCRYDSDREKCTDPFSPTVPEDEVCFFDNATNTELCKKYPDGYQIRCQTGGLTRACLWHTHNLCPGSSQSRTQIPAPSSMCRVTASLSLILSFVLVTKIFALTT